MCIIKNYFSLFFFNINIDLNPELFFSFGVPFWLDGIPYDSSVEDNQSSAKAFQMKKIIGQFRHCGSKGLHCAQCSENVKSIINFQTSLFLRSSLMSRDDTLWSSYHLQYTRTHTYVSLISFPFLPRFIFHSVPQQKRTRKYDRFSRIFSASRSVNSRRLG